MPSRAQRRPVLSRSAIPTSLQGGRPRIIQPRVRRQSVLRRVWATDVSRRICHHRHPCARTRRSKLRGRHRRRQALADRLADRRLRGDDWPRPCEVAWSSNETRDHRGCARRRHGLSRSQFRQGGRGGPPISDGARWTPPRDSVASSAALPISISGIALPMPAQKAIACRRYSRATISRNGRE